MAGHALYLFDVLAVLVLTLEPQEYPAVVAAVGRLFGRWVRGCTRIRGGHEATPSWSGVCPAPPGRFRIDSYNLTSYNPPCQNVSAVVHAGRIMLTAEERMYSLEEVAERLQVSERTVRRWIKSGELPAYKPGREYRIIPSDLDAFLEARKVRPDEENG